MRITAPNNLGHQGGFTLIEIVIAASLMALILASAYLCLNAGFQTQRIIDPRTEVIQNARVAMNLITADLRGACPLVGDSPFLGMPRQLGDMEADNLDFATHNYTPRRAREADYCEESFYVDRNAETGQFSLWRRRNPLFAQDSLSGGERQEIATGVTGLRLEYYDGFDWYDTWGELKAGKKETSHKDQPNLDGMPLAVRVTLMLDSNPKTKKRDEATEKKSEPSLVFETVVQLNLAAQSQDQHNAQPSDSAKDPTAGGSQ